MDIYRGHVDAFAKSSSFCDFSSMTPPSIYLAPGPYGGGPCLWRSWCSRQSERGFPIFSIYPPKPSLLWQDDRLFLRAVCVGVVIQLWLWFMWSSFGSPRGGRSGRCTTITRTCRGRMVLHRKRWMTRGDIGPPPRQRRWNGRRYPPVRNGNTNAVSQAVSFTCLSPYDTTDEYKRPGARSVPPQRLPAISLA